MEWSPLRTAFQEKIGKIWLGIAFLLVAALAFEAGWLKRSLGEIDPLIITTPAVAGAPVVPVRQGAQATRPSESGVTGQNTGATTTCAFVGSKKSNKYHLPSSRCAKQIKAENQLCFESVEAAKAKGYLPGCLE